MCRERVYATHTHTVQSSADLIRAFVELTSCVEYSHNDLQSTLVQFLVHIHRNTAAVVFHGDRVVLVDSYLYVGAVTGHSLVDRVVHSLVYEVMKSFLAYVADVHRRAFAHCLKSFEDLNITGGIVTFVVFYVCHCFLIVLFSRIVRQTAIILALYGRSPNWAH